MRVRNGVAAWLRVALAVLVVAVGAVVAVPSPHPARAALGGLTDFEIDGNQTVDGTPPGAGVDWDNAAEKIQGSVRADHEPCTGRNDDTLNVSGLNTLNVLDPVVQQNSNVSGKADLCNAFAAWEAVTVGNTTHYVLYGAWQGLPDMTGEVSVYMPIIPANARSNADVRLIQFSYTSRNNETHVYARHWNGSSWDRTELRAGLDAATNAPPSSFGEFALDLTATGLIPQNQPCAQFRAPYAFTANSNSDSARLADYVGFDQTMLMDTCSSVRLTKETDPAQPSPPVNFDVTLAREGGVDAHHTRLTVPGNPTQTISDVHSAMDWNITESSPSPWALDSIVCDAFELRQDNPVAQRITVTLVRDGTPTGQRLPVVPAQYLPQGVENSADCTLKNSAPTLTLIKDVNSDARPSPAATPDMWLLRASGPQQKVEVEGSATGVTRVVAPGTYELSERRNPDNPPPVSYDDGTTWDCGQGPTTTVDVTRTNHPVCRIVNKATPAHLTLRKEVNSTGDPRTPPSPEDFTLSATFESGEGDGTLDGQGPITGATGTPGVTDRRVKRGVYNLSETSVPGYQATWRCVNGNGDVISDTPQVDIPTADHGDRAAVLRSITVTCTVTNTYTPVKVDISGPSSNVAGEDHTFTVTVTRSTDAGDVPVQGAVPDLAFVPHGNFTENRDFTVVNNCTQGTSAQGRCTVTIHSRAPGVVEIVARGVSGTASATFETPVTSQKRFRAYRITGARSAINLAGQSHTFTLSGFEYANVDDDGNPVDEGPLEQGSQIRFTWDGPGDATGPAVTPLGGDAYQCTVDVTGTCQVTVSSDAPARGRLTVTGISVFLDRGDGNRTESRVQFGSPGLPGEPVVLTKTWVAFDVKVDTENSVNLVRQDHTFTFTVNILSGNGRSTPATGGTLTYTWEHHLPGLTADPPESCDIRSDGTCRVTVSGTQLGSGRIVVTGVQDVPVSDGVTQTTKSVSITSPLAETALSVPPPATKTWVGFSVALSPETAENLAGETHVVTVQVTGHTPDGDAPLTGVTVDASFVQGSADFNDARSTCFTTGTDEHGQCTIVYTRSSPGTAKLRVTDLHNVTIAGTDFGSQPLFHDGDPAPGLLYANTPSDVQAEKTWFGTRVRLSGDSTNLEGQSHTFTVTAERTTDGETFTPVPDGAMVSFSFVSNPAGAGTVTSENCTTRGTRDGTCEIVVHANVPATGTLTITGARVLLDRGNGVTELAAVPGVAAAHVHATKTWVAQGTQKVEISKVANIPHGTAVRPGSRFSYTITVRNAGTAPVTGVVVSDDLQPGLHLVRIEAGDGWDCARTEAGGVRCTLAELAPGRSRSLRLVVRLDRSFRESSVRNAAVVRVPALGLEETARAVTPVSIKPVPTTPVPKHRKEQPLPFTGMLPDLLRTAAVLLVLGVLSMIPVLRRRRRSSSE